MINLKPTIVQALKKITNNVTEEYPKDFKKLPALTYCEENNALHTVCSGIGEAYSTVTFRIEIWKKGSTSELKQHVDRELSSLGLIRISSIDRNEPELNHTIMRYEGVVDNTNNKIYQN